MAIETSDMDTQKITITLPKRVLTRLNELVPARKRSSFISDALEERLAIEEQVIALEESAGAWTDAAHPDMIDDAAIDRWLETLRSSWSRAGAGHDSLSA